MARRSPAKGFKVDARAPTPPFSKDDDVNSIHSDPFRPSTVQEIIEKKARADGSRPASSADTTLPEIRGRSPGGANLTRVANPTIQLLEQLDGPSRQLPAGAMPSPERPTTSQEECARHQGIPRLEHVELGESTTNPASRCGGQQMLASFGISRGNRGAREQQQMPPKALSPGGGRMRQPRSPPRLRQAIQGTAFTGCRSDQPYFPFVLSAIDKSHRLPVRESLVRDQLQDYALLAVAWQRSRAGVSLAPKSMAVQHAEARSQINAKRQMQRELRGLQLGDYQHEIYRRTHVVDPGDAGLVFFKMATAYDELQDARNALRCCKLYLNVCRQMGDAAGEALACNNIGVQYQYLGGRKNLQKAVSYHSLHLQAGDDLGRFIAYINLGQAYRSMDMMAQSRESALKALECARRAYSAFGESIACAQLGGTMQVVGDPNASRQFLSKYLELAGSMQNAESEEDAWTQLGSLLSSQRQLDQASECYEHAFHLSMQLPNKGSNHARAMLGVMKGEQMVQNALNQAAHMYRQSA